MFRKSIFTAIALVLVSSAAFATTTGRGEPGARPESHENGHEQADHARIEEGTHVRDSGAAVDATAGEQAFAKLIEENDPVAAKIKRLADAKTISAERFSSYKTGLGNNKSNKSAIEDHLGVSEEALKGCRE